MSQVPPNLVTVNLAVEAPTRDAIKAAFTEWANGKPYVTPAMVTAEFVPDVLLPMLKISVR